MRCLKFVPCLIVEGHSDFDILPDFCGSYFHTYVQEELLDFQELIICPLRYDICHN